MKPLIGITLHEDGEYLSLNRAYAKCVAKAGGTPMLLPHGTVTSVKEISHFISGLILSGGGDLDPIYFGEEPQPEMGQIYPERDTWEIELCQLFLKENKPILGICRGIQVLNVAAGGTLWQSIPSKEIKHFQQAPKNYATHCVNITKSSRLAKILDNHELRVNSMHNQAVHKIAPGFKSVGYAIDDLVEAIESEQYKFAIGVQWHPEHLWEYEESRRLFAAFIAAIS